MRVTGWSAVIFLHSAGGKGLDKTLPAYIKLHGSITACRWWLFSIHFQIEPSVMSGLFTFHGTWVWIWPQQWEQWSRQTFWSVGTYCSLVGFAATLHEWAVFSVILFFHFTELNWSPRYICEWMFSQERQKEGKAEARRQAEGWNLVQTILSEKEKKKWLIILLLQKLQQHVQYEQKKRDNFSLRVGGWDL